MALPDLHDALAASNLRRVIIESPCAGDFEQNSEYLADCLRDSLNKGEAPIASHGLLAFSNVLDDTDEEQRRAGMLAGWAWISGADAVVIYADLGITPGMQKAMDLAAHWGLPVETRYLLKNHPAR